MFKTFLTATTALALCGAASIAGAEPLKIGASLPITGNFSINGLKHKQGYELCVDLINARGGMLGREVELIVSDNRSDAATALAQYERFINVDGVEAVFGTFSSKLSFPLSNVLAKYGMVHPLPAGGALRIYRQGHDNLFYFQPNAAEYVGASLNGIIADLVPEGEAPKTAAVVHADDFFANAVAAGLLGKVVTNPSDGSIVEDMSPGYITTAGMDLVYDEIWPEEGFNDWLRLANSIKKSGAEMIIALTASAEEATQLTRALKTVRATPKLVYLSQGTQAEYHEGVGDASDGVVIHTSWHPAAPYDSVLGGQPFSNADFVTAFSAAFGTDPDEDSAIPFAVCQGIEQSILATGGTDNAAMGQWLSDRNSAAPVQTVLGNFHWDETGLAIDKPFLMTQWQNDGELSFIYPTGDFDGIAPFSYPKGGF
ncbi:amino acid ABC transporter substrate-binding protein [Dinoroseobacter sp. S76]|uniref:amino acid ABC transporter substrate-binding protein n=1 Tax=Dinoroseobacter sp. S76 TaxID=3415124 RepID=UPI003C7A0C47